VSKKRICGIVLTVLGLVGIAGYWLYEKSRQADVLARCNKAGGVYVEAHTGPICISPGALLIF
jgi:hypothetical protein